MLRRVCNSLCGDQGIEVDSGEAARIARHAIKLYANGLADESELLQAMKNWLRGRTNPLLRRPGSTSHASASVGVWSSPSDGR
ncbi:hypothetical protein [Mesorhizobium sp. L-8-10]|uniref:hypothetical protein n=2 Tax=unclassified Mesorhizobium TaxID=325217 RepID=UPI001926D21F|nr:hypothetical protein [Mesorhizobium sp. L-8-10]